MKQTMLSIFTVLFLVSCGPTDQQIQAALEKTLTAVPTATYTFIPTHTFTQTPTPTPTPTITSTPTPTATNTPTFTPTPDIQIIDEDPLKYLIKAEELPLDAKYYIPNSNWMSINTNEEVISNRGVEKGRDYVISTGRIIGWWVTLKRGTRSVRAPEEVTSFVGKFKTKEGAQLALRKFNTVEAYPKDGWKYKDVNEGLGDDFIVIFHEKTTSGGDKYIDYEFQYAYRNFMVSISLYGLESDVTHDFALDVGRKILNKLKDAPLVFPPTPTPTP